MKIINCVSLFSILLSLFGCSMDGLDQDVEQKVKIRTLEIGTLTPISGAKVNLLKCSHFDVQFGCQSYAPVASRITNAQGEIEYNRINNVVAMEASHPDYWEKFQEGDYGQILLTPNAWVKIQMEKAGNYRAGSYVMVEAKRECFGWECMAPFFSKNIGLPADTTFVIRVRAAEENTVRWKVISPVDEVVISDVSQPFIIGRFDTLSMKVQY